MAKPGKFDKIYTVTSVSHLIPIKLDLAKLNYTHWSTLFRTHCAAFNVDCFITEDEGSSNNDPSDDDSKKADAVVLGWIFLTVSESLLERVLNSHPKTALEAWVFLKKIFHDNKRSKTIELTAELRSLNIGDQTVDMYFRKIDSIATMLSNLGSKIEDDELVTYAINGLNDKFPHAMHIILHSDPFPNIDVVRSMLTLEEMQLNRKSRVTTDQTSTPSAPTALITQTNTRNTGTPRPNSKSNQVCRNFSRGYCRFADNCRYLHHTGRNNTTQHQGNNRTTNGNNQSQLLGIIAAQQNLLAQQFYRPTGHAYPSQPSFQALNPLAHSFSPPGFHNPGPTSLYPAQQAPVYDPQANYVGQPAPSAAIGPRLNTQVQPNTQQPLLHGFNTGQTSQETLLPHAFSTLNLPDYGSSGWNMDTGATTHLTSSIENLSTIFNHCMYPSVAVGDGNSIPVINTGKCVLPSSHRPLHLNNVLVTPNIVKNLISVRCFTRDNKVSVSFDEFGFSVKDYLTRRLLLRCDSTGDLYPFTTSTSTHRALLTTPSTWHQRLGHPNTDVFRRLISNNSIICNNVKSPVLCHACQLGKHVRLPFSSSTSTVTSLFDIIHSDLWTSPVLSLSGFKYYVIFLDHYSHYLWTFPLSNKSDAFNKFLQFRAYVKTQFKSEIKAFQCDHGGRGI
ncbi:uncharacterized protein [Rutidosis leptorrhynchoides]|uniref:uncharacterized protein n=1 Tax=Rutidosis leptorrhynchoides TaxID=125765 RepID=UPI003A9A1AFC